MPLHKDIRSGSGVTLELQDELIDEFEQSVENAKAVGATAASFTTEKLDGLLAILRAKTKVRVSETPDKRADNMVRVDFDAPRCVRIVFPKHDENWGNW